MDGVFKFTLLTHNYTHSHMSVPMYVFFYENVFVFCCHIQQYSSVKCRDIVIQMANCDPLQLTTPYASTNADFCSMPRLHSPDPNARPRFSHLIMRATLALCSQTTRLEPSSFRSEVRH